MTSAVAPPAPPAPPSLPDSGIAPLPPEQPVVAAFVDVPANVSAQKCSRLMIAVAKGKVTALAEKLQEGDVLVVTYPDDVPLEGTGLVVSVIRNLDGDCAGKKAEKTVVRANAAPKLEWAGGKMSAHLDVAKTLSPEVYLGRLEGTANVAEHEHAGSWEIVAAVEGSGTFVIDGAQVHVEPRQVTFIPPNTKHAWRPDAGSKLVAVQMYSPPGPEQRFIALSAAEKDGGSAK